MLARGWSYIVKAGTVILVCNFVVHLMQTFDWSFKAVDASQSILRDVATPFAYLIAPMLGVVAWQLAAATITGFIAKENLVGTIAVCYGITNFINTESLVLENGSTEVAMIMGITKIAGLAFLMFNLFSPPCFAAIGAMHAEIKDKKWFWGGICLQLSVGFVLGFLTYFVGTLLTGAKFGEAWMPILGFVITILIVGAITLLIIRKNNQLRANEKA